MQSNKLPFFIIVGLAILAVIGMAAGRFWFNRANPIVLSVLYSTEKEAWLAEAAKNFAGQVDDRPIQVELKMMGSNEMNQVILDDQARPDLISPASSLQISILQDLSAAKFGRPLVNSTACRSVVNTPLVVVAWRERSQALWGDNPNSHMWQRLHDALVEPSGWQAYGHAEWGYIKFGHTDPFKSNSGLMTLLLMTYGYQGKTNGLTANDLLSNDAYRQWFNGIEGAISTFGDSTGTYMKDMVVYGPSKYDLIAVYESTAIEQAANAAGRYGELQIYYPPATVLSDHPFCTLQADWVTTDQAKAGQVFVDYLLSRPVQEKALVYGFRPADPAIPLTEAGSPFSRQAVPGLRVDLPPQVEVPPGNVLNILLDMWRRSARR
jgi:ABC-type Fe3+ transport system substrate-binding protein